MDLIYSYYKNYVGTRITEGKILSISHVLGFDLDFFLSVPKVFTNDLKLQQQLKLRCILQVFQVIKILFSWNRPQTDQA